MALTLLRANAQMFPKHTPTGTETDQAQDHFIAGERHCILVAASNPMLIPTAVSMPIISNGQFSSGTNIQLSLADAQTVAKAYAQVNIEEDMQIIYIPSCIFSTFLVLIGDVIKSPNNVCFSFAVLCITICHFTKTVSKTQRDI